jgi:hypothetical protein
MPTVGPPGHSRGNILPITITSGFHGTSTKSGCLILSALYYLMDTMERTLPFFIFIVFFDGSVQIERLTIHDLWP